MPRIELSTHIAAPPNRVFDLARSIDLHTASTSATREQAIAGTTTGLFGPNQQVTWRAKHFGIWQTLTVEMTAFEPPKHFSDKMVRGAFKFMEHDHFFDPDNSGTVMRDVFVFESPFSIFGQLIDCLFLRRYMRSFLVERNAVIKNVAESDEWKHFVIDA